MSSKVLTFKDIMHEPMLIEGCGNIDKLTEILGDYNVTRLKDLGMLKSNNGEFSLTEQGMKFLKVFNRK